MGVGNKLWTDSAALWINRECTFCQNEYGHHKNYLPSKHFFTFSPSLWTCIRKGPFSLNIPYMEGQPGPPCSQRTNGPIITLVWGMTHNIKPFVRNKKLLDSSLINLHLDSSPSGRARRKVESLSQDQLSRNHWSSQHPPAHQPLWIQNICEGYLGSGTNVPRK